MAEVICPPPFFKICALGKLNFVPDNGILIPQQITGPFMPVSLELFHISADSSSHSEPRLLSAGVKEMMGSELLT